MSKIFFDISLSKTATTSRWEAARIAGYRAVHFPRGNFQPRIGGYYSDSPIPARALEYLAYYGDRAKFLYVERDLEEWLDSWDKHNIKVLEKGFLDMPNFRANRVAVYGQIEYDRDVWASVWLRHRDMVEKIPSSQLSYQPYFMQMSSAWQWSTMLNFLECDKTYLVHTTFPRKNVI